MKKGKKITKETIFLTCLIISIIILDQGIKIWAHNIDKINLLKNTQSAYGIGSNSTLTYVTTNIVILGIILKFMATQNQFVDKKFKIFLSFILAGGISNTIDRIIRGYVTEFIDFGHNLPVWNVADFFVLLGWVSVAATFAVFTVREWKSKKAENQLEDKDKS